ncbi:hypothetical protein [Clostridium sp.]
MNKKQIDEIESILMYYFNYKSIYREMEFEKYVDSVIRCFNENIREGK